jgi:Mn-dependent DtxR family transcriptional regulator
LLKSGIKEIGMKKEMDEKESNEYLESIAKGEIELSKYGAKIAEKLRNATDNLVKYQKEVNEIRAKLVEANNKMMEFSASIQVLSLLLVEEENERIKKGE